MKYSNKKGGFAVGLIVLAIAALSVLGIVAVEKNMKPIEAPVDNVVGSGGKVQTAATGITSLTPWTSNIDGGGYSITNILNASSTQLTTSGSTWLAKTTGTVGIGVGSDSSAVLDVHQSGNTIPMIQAQDSGANSASSGGIFQATLDNGGAPVSGTRIGGYQYSADIGDAVKRVGSAINALATETWTTTANGTQLKFNVTANGASTRTAALVLDQTGNVGIATTTPSQMLSVAGTVLANNYQATSTTAVSSFVGVKAGTKVNTDGATITVDWLQGPTQEVVLGATGRTLAFSNVQPGAALKLWVWQDATGSRTITTYPTGTHWAGGSAPTLTTGAGKFDILVFTTASSTTQFSAGASLNY